MAKMEVLHLTPTQRGELHAFLRSRNLPASVAQRMRIVLMLDEGISYHDIQEKLGTPPSTISRWKQRYEKEGVVGLATVHPGQPPQKLTAQLRAKVLERTRQIPSDGSTHWSLRKMAAVMKVSKNLIARIWKEADLKPHRLERYMASNDPAFEQKAATIIGLYLNPPQNAAIFCVDEKSAIQALDRLDRRLPLSPGRAERHGFEYHRHGTLSLYAALNAATPQRAVSLHAHLFVVAQSGRKLVQQTPAGCNRSRHIHFRDGSQTQNHALHPSLPKDCQTISVEIFRCPKTDPGLVAMAQGQPTRSQLYR